MNNITFTLTRDKADALCTLLSMLQDGSELQGLYKAIQGQLLNRGYNYRMSISDGEHSVYNIPLLALTRK